MRAWISVLCVIVGQNCTLLAFRKTLTNVTKRALDISIITLTQFGQQNNGKAKCSNENPTHHGDALSLDFDNESFYGN